MDRIVYEEVSVGAGEITLAHVTSKQLEQLGWNSSSYARSVLSLLGTQSSAVHDHSHLVSFPVFVDVLCQVLLLQTTTALQVPGCRGIGSGI